MKRGSNFQIMTIDSPFLNAWATKYVDQNIFLMTWNKNLKIIWRVAVEGTVHKWDNEENYRRFVGGFSHCCQKLILVDYLWFPLNYFKIFWQGSHIAAFSGDSNEFFCFEQNNSIESFKVAVNKKICTTKSLVWF